MWGTPPRPRHPPEADAHREQVPLNLNNYGIGTSSSAERLETPRHTRKFAPPSGALACSTLNIASCVNHLAAHPSRGRRAEEGHYPANVLGIGEPAQRMTGPWA